MMRLVLVLILAAGLISPTYPAVLPQAPFQIQPIAKGGDPVGGVRIKSNPAFAVGALNDKGQLLFNADGAAGGQLLIQSADGKLTPIASPGGVAPGGTWPPDLAFYSPVSINPAGNAVFAASVTVGGKSDVGTFRWDNTSKQISLVALNGMAIGNNLILSDGGGPTPVINASGEIAFSAAVQNTAGQVLGFGVFFMGQDGKLQPVALPGQVLPDGATALQAFSPSLNGAGAIAFMAIRTGDTVPGYPSLSVRSAYLWEGGALTPLSDANIAGPPWTLLVGFNGIWINSKNRNELVEVHLHSIDNHFYALYLIANGVPMPVASPGTPMPGGGTFLNLQDGGVSNANDAGQHAFLARLYDGTTAAYRMDADGKLSLILKSGMVTPLGQITNVGQGSGWSQGVTLNNNGQVAVTVGIAKAPDTLVLLTPAKP